MLSKLSLAVAATSALLLTGAAEARGGDKTTVCHRVSKQLINGYFPGHILETSSSGLAAHLGHGDVQISPTQRAKFGSSRICLTDAGGKLHDQHGVPIDGGSDDRPG